jgi:hypothetical protein
MRRRCWWRPAGRGRNRWRGAHGAGLAAGGGRRPVPFREALDAKANALLAPLAAQLDDEPALWPYWRAPAT